MRNLHVCHVITGLEIGGAESMLVRLIRKTSEWGISHSVVSLMDGGAYSSTLRAMGIPVTSLGLARATPDPRGIIRLARAVRASRPSVVQSWMYHADALSSAALPFWGKSPVVWGLHHTDAARSRFLTRVTRRACAIASHVVPARIVCCSESVRAAHIAVGYSASRMTVINNGVDLAEFSPDDRARAGVRGELGVAEETPLIGHIARVAPEKDHETYIAAAARVLRQRPDAVFVLCGRGTRDERSPVMRAIERAGIRSAVRLLGPRGDVPRLLSSFDVLASSSVSEGLPNVIIEALSTGVLCVVTDCGDCKYIVGEAGAVVRPRDPEALARAILSTLCLPPADRARLRTAGRARAQRLFNVESASRKYVDLYSHVCREYYGDAGAESEAKH